MNRPEDGVNRPIGDLDSDPTEHSEVTSDKASPPSESADDAFQIPPYKEYIMSFLEHLDDLRKRLMRAVLILIIGTLIALFFSEQLLKIITATFKSSDMDKLALLYPTEGFVVRLKVAFVAGLFGTSPFWFAQVWGFVSPGLYKKEKKVIIPAILASAFAFSGGAWFGYWILPYAVDYFQSFATSDVGVSWSLGKYLDFSLRLLVAFGVVFEMPLIVYALARLGVVTTAQLRKYRRHVIVVLLILSGFITPPDFFTQIVLAIPLYILYEIGLLAATIALRNKKVKEK